MLKGTTCLLAEESHLNEFSPARRTLTRSKPVLVTDGTAYWNIKKLCISIIGKMHSNKMIILTQIRLSKWFIMKITHIVPNSKLRILRCPALQTTSSKRASGPEVSSTLNVSLLVSSCQYIRIDQSSSISRSMLPDVSAKTGWPAPNVLRQQSIDSEEGSSIDNRTNIQSLSIVEPSCVGNLSSQPRWLHFQASTTSWNVS